MTTPEYRRSYALGYAAGLRRAWPKVLPPSPPDMYVSALIEAAYELRNEAMGICQMLLPDDDFVVSLQPAIDKVDGVLEDMRGFVLEALAQPAEPT